MRMEDEQRTGIQTGQPIASEVAWDEISSAFLKGRASSNSIGYGPLSPPEADLGLLPKLVGDLRGLDVLEAGCGGGQNAIHFAARGAHVTAVDFSTRQLAHADRAAREAGVEVTFRQESVESLNGLLDESYDLVFCAHVLPYIEDAQLALACFRRVLRKGGWLVASMDHPFRACFYAVDDSSLTNYAERSYYAAGARSWRFRGTNTTMCSFDRTVSDWVELLRQAGLPLRHMLEPPVPVDILDDVFPADGPLATMRNIPHTLIFAAGGPRKAYGVVSE